MKLERLLGRKQREVDFFKRAFEQVRGAASNGVPAMAARNRSWTLTFRSGSKE